ncbi:hypothetical protein WJX84_010127 [Apatococcus fuscideae]|uniref:Uncharacterized protein n=1 Tax=Apatococcus fuscideae TaxID=2026836 RepID=A0AAW1TE02_9CHLO
MRLRPHPICNILTYKLLSFSRKRAVCLSCPSQGVEKHPALSLPSQGSRLDQSSRTVSFRGLGYRTRANMASQADEYTGGAVVVYVTVPDDTVAKTIASGVVEQKLAACVSILPGIQSVFWWDNKVNIDAELMLIMKTRQELVRELTGHIKANHPYDERELGGSRNLEERHDKRQSHFCVLNQPKRKGTRGGGSAKLSSASLDPNCWAEGASIPMAALHTMSLAQRGCGVSQWQTIDQNAPSWKYPNIFDFWATMDRLGTASYIKDLTIEDCDDGTYENLRTYGAFGPQDLSTDEISAFQAAVRASPYINADRKDSLIQDATHGMGAEEAS